MLRVCVCVRFTDSPKKHYTCAALDTVSAFCKLQEKGRASREEEKGLLLPPTPTLRHLVATQRACEGGANLSVRGVENVD